MRKYKLNEDFFKKIDSEEKAYFLGLLFADGYNQENRSKYIGISLIEQDKYILDKFQKSLGSNYKLRYDEHSLKNKNHSNSYYLQINSMKMSQDISKIGCIQNKSLCLKFPDSKFLRKKLFHHFIRGYFDGNGSVWEGKRHKALIKDKASILGERTRIIHNVKFNITGAYDIIYSIQDILIHNIKLKRNIINDSKKIGKCVQLEYSGRLQMRKFYEYLYKDATLYLKRKKRKFEKIIKQIK